MRNQRNIDKLLLHISAAAIFAASAGFAFAAGSGGGGGSGGVGEVGLQALMEGHRLVVRRRVPAILLHRTVRRQSRQARRVMQYRPALELAVAGPVPEQHHSYSRRLDCPRPEALRARYLRPVWGQRSVYRQHPPRPSAPAASTQIRAAICRLPPLVRPPIRQIRRRRTLEVRADPRQRHKPFHRGSSVAGPTCRR